MVILGVNIGIIQSGKILLTKREDFEVWCLPGGIVDPGESLAQAAVRETREETGLEIELLRLVGAYSEIGRGDGVHIVLFAGQPVGGSLKPQAGEVLELGYFDPKALPEMLWWHHQRVDDVFNGAGGGMAWRTEVKPQERINSREELYALRDRSGLGRAEFYRYFFEQNGTNEVILEVGETTL